MRKALLLVGVSLALAAPAAALAPPGLRVRSFQPFAIEGARFKAFERVTVTLDGMWVRRVRAGAAGSFTAMFRGIAVSRCDGFWARATGARGSRAALKVRPLACPTIRPG